ncbi:hypothetical protein OHT77_00400 [Streptomyces sp. NBC_00252]|uniref:hypothetical protein n=1 Tax=Streptomyces sp. NBC_00252 TaxID=2975691 RepID=UPI002E2E487F|nr:hypothetical protein [Streptomyces sp. NBC_00252]
MSVQNSGLYGIWPRTTSESQRDLVTRIRNARSRINFFGLTRNFYARDEILPVFEEKGRTIPVNFYVMDPNCASRKDRYRLEPPEAAMEDPRRYTREVLRPLFDAAKRVSLDCNPNAGLKIWTYNFQCSFGVEEVDDAYRVMLYGHGKRGTESPILGFGEGSEFAAFFAGQVRWLERLAAENPEPWQSKGLAVRPLIEDTLLQNQ